MESMISAIVSIKELLSAEEREISYLRTLNSRAVDKHSLSAERVFVVPKYQREIRWSTNNIQVLVDDVRVAPKFLGIILMSTKDNINYDIIDGQQRVIAIIMLIKAINKRHGKEKYKICSFINESFPNIVDAIDNDFYAGSAEEIEKCKKKDVLNQYDDLSILWQYSNKLIKELGEEEFSGIEERLLESEINILIQPIKDRIDQKRVCIDYFIDINNKRVKLDYIDILKAYAFKEDFENTIDKWVLILNKIKESKNYLYYPYESMFLHYMLSTINSKLDYGVKALSDEYKITKETTIRGVKHEIGTDIEILIEEKNYYTKMLDTVAELLDFAKIVVGDKSTYSADFEKYVHPTGASVNDEFKQNMFVIINGILRSSDVVPKLLFMKYFVEVIQNINAKKEDYELIYPIGILTSLFTAGKGDSKNRKEFSALVLSKNWDNNLKTKAYKKFLKSNSSIMYDKEIKDKLTKSEASGQYLARRIHAIYYFVSCGEKLKYHPHLLYQFYGSPEYNDEHFLVNQSYSIDYQIKGKDIKYEYNDSITSYVSHIGNFLCISREVNSKLGNKTIKDKIRIIENCLETGTLVFQDKLSEIIYQCAKDVFLSSACPIEEELKSMNVDEAKAKIKEYYEGNFVEDYQKYSQKLKQIISELDMKKKPLKTRRHAIQK